MSEYHNYEQEDGSSAYAASRPPHCAETFLAFIKLLSQKPLAGLHILDAGCGPGMYALALLRAGARKLTLLDASTAQLNLAKKRLSSFAEYDQCDVTFVQHFLPSLPVDEKSVDVIICSQVLHHLSASDITASLLRFYDALRPGGILCTVHSTPDQVMRGQWARRPWEAKTRHLINRLMSAQELNANLVLAGFNVHASLALCHAPDLQPIPGGDVLAAFRDPRFRAANSFLATLSDEEVNEGLELLKNEELVQQWKAEAGDTACEVANISVRQS